MLLSALITGLSLTQAAAPLPECPDWFERGVWYDCIVALDSGEQLEATSNGHGLTFAQIAPSGEARVIALMPDYPSFQGYELKDLDLDGQDEWILTMPYCGIANCDQAVFQRNASGEFVPAGLVNGTGLRPAEVPGGLIMGDARASAADRIATAWTLTEDGLELAYSMDQSFFWIQCWLEEGPAFDRLGLNAAAEVEACEAAIPNPDPYIDLPPCDSDQGEARLFNCRLAIPAGPDMPVRYYVRAEMGSDAGENIVTLAMHMRNGNPHNVIDTLETGFGSGQIHFEDLDRNGRAELVVPLFTGNVNTTFAVYAWDEESWSFAFAGEFSGLGFDYDPETGFVEIGGRSSAASYYNEFYAVDGAVFSQVMTIEVDLQNDRCDVRPGEGFAQSGLDLAAQQAACDADTGAP